MLSSLNRQAELIISCLLPEDTNRLKNIVSKLKSGPLKGENFNDLCEMPVLALIKPRTGDKKQQQKMIIDLRGMDEIISQLEVSRKKNCVVGYTTFAPYIILRFKPLDEIKISLKMEDRKEVIISVVYDIIRKRMLLPSFKEIQGSDYDVWIYFTGVSSDFPNEGLTLGIAQYKFHISMKLPPRELVRENIANVIELIRWLWEYPKMVKFFKEVCNYIESKSSEHNLFMITVRVITALIQMENSISGHSDVERLVANLEMKLAEHVKGNPKDPYCFLQLFVDQFSSQYCEMKRQKNPDKTPENPFVTIIENQIICKNCCPEFESKKSLLVLELPVPDEKRIPMIVFVVQDRIGDEGSWSIRADVIKGKKVEDVRRMLSECIGREFFLVTMIGNDSFKGYCSGRIHEELKDGEDIDVYLDKSKKKLILYALILPYSSRLLKRDNAVLFEEEKKLRDDTTRQSTRTNPGEGNLQREESLSGNYPEKEDDKNLAEQSGGLSRKNLTEDEDAPTRPLSLLGEIRCRYVVVKKVGMILRMITFERIMVLNLQSTLADIYRYVHELLGDIFGLPESATMLNERGRKKPFKILIPTLIDHSLEKVPKCKFCRGSECRGCPLPYTKETLEEYFKKCGVELPKNEKSPLVENFFLKIILNKEYKKNINISQNRVVSSIDLKTCISQHFCDADLVTEKTYRCSKCNLLGKLQGLVRSWPEILIIKFKKPLAVSDVDATDKLVLKNYEGTEAIYDLFGVMKWNEKGVRSYLKTDKEWIVKDLFEGAYILFFGKRE
eukprot:TRINITY_DN6198_c0_g1_i10.p1 TRINITY_DN6198_c0_g1~~TRINITY_DN6198_c0_g1_i10.p1  ORF type:complete len:784 (-),score=105.70 TRINITY_DN6198_c0_g1_i10:125-2476(-)